MNKQIIFLVFLLFIYPCGLCADDISGKWYVTADGWTYIMDLTQRGAQFFGSCMPQSRNRELDSNVFGEINEVRVTFMTNNKKLSVIRQFKGTLITSLNGWAMTGTYSENNQRNKPWHAVRY